MINTSTAPPNTPTSSLTCHLAAAGNPIYAIWFIKIFAAALILIALLLYEISKKDPKIAIPLAAGLAAYGTGYLWTLADGYSTSSHTACTSPP